MTEDWAAVSRALVERMDELGMSQEALKVKAKVSRAIIGELCRNSAQRERNPGTLERLSAALGWNRQHLAAVRDGLEPPRPDEREIVSDNDVPSRLTAVEQNVRKMAAQLDELIESMHKDRRLDEISPEALAVLRQLFMEFLPPRN
ncbi:MAG TPA: transcriptional regulator [Pseudonocardiaceae bacterium]|nr:transcriptional regulator [Pseudonocardiaceae bacterium]